MDKMSYPFATLSLKYKNFVAPSCEIAIGSLKVKETDCMIRDLMVELSADGAASGCSFYLYGIYDFEKTAFSSEVTSAVKVGAKLTVSLGYISTKKVFEGYVDEFTVEYNRTGDPCIFISGMDGLGYLMGVRDHVFAGETKVGEMVKKLLGGSVSAGAASSVTVGASVKDMTVQRIKEGIDSYTYLKTLARQLGVNLLSSKGELVFDKVITSTTSLTTLTYGDGLRSFRKRVSVANQPGKVIVHGLDINNEPVEGEVTSTKLSGSGSPAASTASKLLKKAVYEEDSPLAKTADECKALAQNRFDMLAIEYVNGFGTCVGLPELMAGRYVTVEGMDKNTNGSYFLSRVTHYFNEDGYNCSFEVKGAKSK